MASSGSWLPRVASALGQPGPAQRLSGGAWRFEVAGRSYVAKVGPGALDEAAGLRRLAGVTGAPPVPEVVLAETDLVVTRWVEQTVRTSDHEASLGRMLAALHSGAWPEWGGGSAWIGGCPVDPSGAPDAAAFYGSRLVGLAGRCGMEAQLSAVVSRLGELLPPGRPAPVHGDLWWGNVLWGADGRPWLIDPSVHGGHPEEDLAMLDLFGAVPDRLLRAYCEVRALEPGWQERKALFQLYPLLVHTVLFGGGYRAQAELIVRRFA